MGIRFACHVCDKRLNIKRELAGRRGVCPACSAKFRIPTEDTEKSSPVESSRGTVAGGDAAGGAVVGGDASDTLTSVPTSTPAPMLTDPEAIRLSDDEPDATWYVRPPNGGQYGPASSDVLKQWVAEGRVAATALLWRDGWPQWRDAVKVLPELATELPGSGATSGINTAAVTPGDSTPGDSTPESSSESSVGMAGSAGVLERPQARQRMLLIGILSVLSILLVGVLVFVMNR